MKQVDLAMERVSDGWHMAHRDASKEDAVVLAAEVSRLRRLLESTALAVVQSRSVREWEGCRAILSELEQVVYEFWKKQ